MGLALRRCGRDDEEEALLARRGNNDGIRRDRSPLRGLTDGSLTSTAATAAHANTRHPAAIIIFFMLFSLYFQNLVVNFQTI